MRRTATEITRSAMTAKTMEKTGDEPLEKMIILDNLLSLHEEKKRRMREKDRRGRRREFRSVSSTAGVETPNVEI